MFDKAGIFPLPNGRYELQLLFKLEFEDKEPEFQSWVWKLTSKTLDEAKVEAVAEMIGLGIPTSLDDFKEI